MASKKDKDLSTHRTQVAVTSAQGKTGSPRQFSAQFRKSTGALTQQGAQSIVDKVAATRGSLPAQIHVGGTKRKELGAPVESAAFQVTGIRQDGVTKKGQPRFVNCANVTTFHKDGSQSTAEVCARVPAPKQPKAAKKGAKGASDRHRGYGGRY